ncbi:MAG: hypothetical protein RIF41_27910 [Polyangiaceae bacterium]
MSDDPTEARKRAMEKLAHELVDASIAQMNAELGTPLPPGVVEQLRWALIDELLLTPEGRMRLRRSLGDPEVEQSEVVDEPTRDESGAAGGGGA